MRTTLDIEDDVLQAAKELAQTEGTSAGKVLSKLARRGLSAPEAPQPQSSKFTIRNGVPIFPRSGQVVTLEKVRKIMDEEGI
jgi:hypothetical protein